MIASELMTTPAVVCVPEDTIQQAARLMAEHECGCLPVVASGKPPHLVGVITDRDISMRAVAEGKGLDAPVQEVMTSTPLWCEPDDDVHTVGRIMALRKVRRLPVRDREGLCIVIIAQADVAREDPTADASFIGQIVRRISEPTPSSGLRRSEE